MAAIVYQDGCFVHEDEVRISPFSGAFLHGFTLFETVRIYGGSRAFQLEKHLERLNRSARAFELDACGSLEETARVASRLCRENSIDSGRLRITLAARGDSHASLVISIMPYSPPSGEEYAAGWEGRTAPFRRHLSSPLRGHKHGSNLECTAFGKSLGKGVEGIVLNDPGRLCEGCRTNIFAVSGTGLFTPPDSEGCLPGITRAAAIEAAGKLGIPFHAEKIDPGFVIVAAEVFLTNAMIGVMPVTMLDGRRIGAGIPGPVTERISAEYARMVREESVSLDDPSLVL